MSGNPLVRFDEGRVGRTSVSPSLLLYRVPLRVSAEGWNVGLTRPLAFDFLLLAGPTGVFTATCAPAHQLSRRQYRYGGARQSQAFSGALGGKRGYPLHGSLWMTAYWRQTSPADSLRGTRHSRSSAQKTTESNHLLMTEKQMPLHPMAHVRPELRHEIGQTRAGDIGPPIHRSDGCRSAHGRIIRVR
jgi:hypothetical protein